MSSHQEILLVGNLGKDPEMRYTPAGKAVTNFSMATNEKWTGQDGQQHEKVTWWRVAAWGKLAEICNQYLQKGRQVLVKGKMNPDDSGNPRVFQRNNGEYGASYEVTASRVVFLGGRGDAPAQSDDDFGDDEEESEIPF